MTQPDDDARHRAYMALARALTKPDRTTTESDDTTTERTRQP